VVLINREEMSNLQRTVIYWNIYITDLLKSRPLNYNEKEGSNFIRHELNNYFTSSPKAFQRKM
jgi:hypothetical protein